MEGRTSIQIEHNTLMKLKELKEKKSETYDEVFNRILEERKWEKSTPRQFYIGEFIDRFSILLLKAQRIGPESYIEFVAFAEDFLLNTPINKFDEIMKGFRKLYSINKSIWDLESDLKNGNEKKHSLSKLGEKAIKIRDFNNKRIKEQNRLIELFGGYPNIKKNHLSSEEEK